MGITAAGTEVGQGRVRIEMVDDEMGRAMSMSLVVVGVVLCEIWDDSEQVGCDVASELRGQCRVYDRDTEQVILDGVLGVILAPLT